MSEIASFRTLADWNAPELLQQTAIDQLQRLGNQPGATVYLLLDDTQKSKRGKSMAAVSKIFLHAEKVYANGHTMPTTIRACWQSPNYSSATTLTDRCRGRLATLLHSPANPYACDS